MRERHSPRPKMKPVDKPAIDFAHVRPHKTWRTTKTVTIAVATKMATAAAERGDNRDTPQMPWPDVQPLAERHTDADKETRGDKERGPDRRRTDAVVAGHERQHGGRQDKPKDKGDAPGAIVSRFGRQETSDDAADARDAAGERHEHHGR